MLCTQLLGTTASDSNKYCASGTTWTKLKLLLMKPKTSYSCFRCNLKQVTVANHYRNNNMLQLQPEASCSCFRFNLKLKQDVAASEATSSCVKCNVKQVAAASGATWSKLQHVKSLSEPFRGAGWVVITGGTYSFIVQNHLNQPNHPNTALAAPGIAPLAQLYEYPQDARFSDSLNTTFNSAGGFTVLSWRPDRRSDVVDQWRTSSRIIVLFYLAACSLEGLTV